MSAGETDEGDDTVYPSSPGYIRERAGRRIRAGREQTLAQGRTPEEAPVNREELVQKQALGDRLGGAAGRTQSHDERKFKSEASV